jgi:hypothetical protein
MIRQSISRLAFRIHLGPILPVAVALILGTSPAAAQESWDVSRQASPTDVSSIDGIIDAFYDIVSGPAGEARDWTRDSTLYLPGVRFVIVSRDQVGQLVARNLDHGSFATGSNASLEQGFYEREINRLTRQFGPMADVFSTYEWSRTEDGPVGGRGINSIQLFNDGSRWWITGAIWASEEAENPIPDEYLPD